MAPACLSSACADNERCKIASDVDFRFKMGFLRKEPVCDNWLGGGVAFGGPSSVLLIVVCNGPYSQVTSDSFSLEIHHISKKLNLVEARPTN